MEARGNIVVHFPDGGRIYLSTPDAGEYVELVLAEALAELRVGVAAEVCGWVAARFMEFGEPELSLARPMPDVDEYHVDVATGEVFLVTLDVLESEDGCIVSEREIARWDFEGFLEQAFGVSREERELILSS